MLRDFLKLNRLIKVTAVVFSFIVASVAYADPEPVTLVDPVIPETQTQAQAQPTPDPNQIADPTAASLNPSPLNSAQEPVSLIGVAAAIPPQGEEVVSVVAAVADDPYIRREVRQEGSIGVTRVDQDGRTVLGTLLDRDGRATTNRLSLSYDDRGRVIQRVLFRSDDGTILQRTSDTYQGNTRNVNTRTVENFTGNGTRMRTTIYRYITYAPNGRPTEVAVVEIEYDPQTGQERSRTSGTSYFRPDAFGSPLP